MKKFLFFPLLALLMACSENPDHDVVIANVNIIELETGEIIPDQSIAIDGDTISEIYSTTVQFSDSTRIVNGSGRYLIPGYWDMHVHHRWNYEDANPLLIANGVVGMREMWGDMFVHKTLERAREEGTMDVPDIYTGSIIIDGAPKVWPGSIEVSNAEEARKVALEQIESGVDFLKVYSLLSAESFDAIADVANEKGITFGGHVPESVSIQHAAQKGMVSAEHMFGVLVGSSSNRDSLIEGGVSEYMTPEQVIATFDQNEFESMCKVIVDNDLWMCPTLITNKGTALMLDREYTNDERLAYVPEYMTNTWMLDSAERSHPRTIAYVESQNAFHESTFGLVGEMSNLGVRFLAGTDYPNPWCFPGFSLHDEMALFVEGGMDNLTALQSATLNPAIFLKKEDKYGSLEKGKMASMVLLNKNPLEDIANTQSIEAVFLRGKVFERDELDQSLETIKYNLADQFEVAPWLRTSIKNQGIDVALDSLDIIIAQEPCNPRLTEKDINMLGYELMMYDDTESAAKLLAKNVELFPESFNVYDSYAEVQMTMGNFEEAKKNYQKALELNPYLENAKVMLDSLKHSGSWQPEAGGRMIFLPHYRAHLNSEHGHQH